MGSNRPRRSGTPSCPIGWPTFNHLLRPAAIGQRALHPTSQVPPRAGIPLDAHAPRRRDTPPLPYWLSRGQSHTASRCHWAASSASNLTGPARTRDPIGPPSLGRAQVPALLPLLAEPPSVTIRPPRPLGDMAADHPRLTAPAILLVASSIRPPSRSPL
ncbi:hypothetical protein chiPu_0023236 [Chiloscyllium punctatum]|uniref:Uncharacterized protein n=1 Tax=Chiloscyllium punctatum TaxID=137246 RepID=A0A401T804_CHIPU|nr:hypothetical protein [Chiloscyllium punctatum]